MMVGLWVLVSVNGMSIATKRQWRCGQTWASSVKLERPVRRSGQVSKGDVAVGIVEARARGFSNATLIRSIASLTGRRSLTRRARRVQSRPPENKIATLVEIWSDFGCESVGISVTRNLREALSW